MVSDFITGERANNVNGNILNNVGKDSIDKSVNRAEQTNGLWRMYNWGMVKEQGNKPNSTDKRNTVYNGSSGMQLGHKILLNVKVKHRTLKNV